MILKELFREHQPVITLPPDARISDAAELMRRENVGSIVIIDGRQIAGIITDRDVALSVTLGAATPESLVAEVMTKEVETVNDTMTLFDVTRYLRSTRVKRLPVVDGDNRLVGIVSTDDVMALLAREMFDTCTSLESKLGHMV